MIRIPRTLLLFLPPPKGRQKVGDQVNGPSCCLRAAGIPGKVYLCETCESVHGAICKRDIIYTVPTVPNMFHFTVVDQDAEAARSRLSTLQPKKRKRSKNPAPPPVTANTAKGKTEGR